MSSRSLETGYRAGFSTFGVLPGPQNYMKRWLVGLCACGIASHIAGVTVHSNSQYRSECGRARGSAPSATGEHKKASN